MSNCYSVCTYTQHVHHVPTVYSTVTGQLLTMQTNTDFNTKCQFTTLKIYDIMT